MKNILPWEWCKVFRKNCNWATGESITFLKLQSLQHLLNQNFQARKVSEGWDEPWWITSGHDLLLHDHPAQAFDNSGLATCVKLKGRPVEWPAENPA